MTIKKRLARSNIAMLVIPLLAAAAPAVLTAGPLTADTASRRVTKDGAEIPLKNREYELLLFLSLIHI